MLCVYKEASKLRRGWGEGNTDYLWQRRIRVGRVVNNQKGSSFSGQNLSGCRKTDAAILNEERGEGGSRHKYWWRIMGVHKCHRTVTSQEKMGWGSSWNWWRIYGIIWFRYLVSWKTKSWFWVERMLCVCSAEVNSILLCPTATEMLAASTLSTANVREGDPLITVKEILSAALFLICQTSPSYTSLKSICCTLRSDFKHLVA